MHGIELIGVNGGADVRVAGVVGEGGLGVGEQGAHEHRGSWPVRGEPELAGGGAKGGTASRGGFGSIPLAWSSNGRWRSCCGGWREQCRAVVAGPRELEDAPGVAVVHGLPWAGRSAVSLSSPAAAQKGNGVGRGIGFDSARMGLN